MSQKIESPSPIMESPKILLLDIENSVNRSLSYAGYNCSSGSFGRPFRVSSGGRFHAVIPNDRLEGISEMEVVIVDLTVAPAVGKSGEKVVPAHELDWWMKPTGSEQTIDPRPRSMEKASIAFDRIYLNGGIFIVFAEPKVTYSIKSARLSNGTLYDGQEETKTTWDFLSELGRVSATADSGQEINCCAENLDLNEVLTRHFEHAQFSCCMRGFYPQQESVKWQPLAKNKFGETVSVMIEPTEGSDEGFIFIFPQVENQAALLTELLKDVLPSMAPNFFPFSESKKWESQPEYEFPAVRKKRLEIKRVEDNAREEVLRLGLLVDEELAKYAFLFELVTGTGDALVDAVIKALQLIGFRNVVDMDKKLKAEGKANSLREDLRIEDKEPLLIVDVKGVNGHPSDGEALQSSKHAMIYMQESDNTKVRALSIINHQRSRPPLERDNSMPFRKEILDNARQVNIGLMTGWDLFRLARGVIRHDWNPNVVTPLFYQIERIVPIPTHYKYIGSVAQVWKGAGAFSIHLENEPLQTGDFISIEFPVDFEEQEIESIRLNDAEVTKVESGVEIGLKWNSSLTEVKAGLAVYRVLQA